MKVLNVRSFEICHLLLKHMWDLEKRRKIEDDEDEYVHFICTLYNE